MAYIKLHKRDISIHVYDIDLTLYRSDRFLIPVLFTLYTVFNGQQCTESSYADARPLPSGNNTNSDNQDVPCVGESEAHNLTGRLAQAATNYQAQDNSSRTTRYNMDAQRQPSANLQRTRSVPDLNLMLVVPAGARQHANGVLQANIPAVIASLQGSK